VALLDPAPLVVSGDLVGLEGGESRSVVLVPEAGGRGRAQLLRLLRGRPAVVGPSRPWTAVASSYRRAVRAAPLVTGDDVVDTDERLADLVLGADPEALADLRARVLAPLAAVKPDAAERLAQTLRSWLLHHGRREEVAADLVVHPQTVRYRMTQLRELYGDRLTDPTTVLELTVALAVRPR
jgi:DNA-binding PucR family transcriptional regulator